jgi:hypothetical protein
VQGAPRRPVGKKLACALDGFCKHSGEVWQIERLIILDEALLMADVEVKESHRTISRISDLAGCER